MLVRCIENNKSREFRDAVLSTHKIVLHRHVSQCWNASEKYDTYHATVMIRCAVLYGEAGPGCQIWAPSGLDWSKYGTFSDQISVHFGSICTEI